MTKLRILIGDITQSDADIIVFSAHPSLLAGSGVSGAIHKAAGKELETAAKKFAPLKVGEAIITPAFGLKSKYVIHTVCPRYILGTDQEEAHLSKAYRAALNFHNSVTDASSIAFMSMGTGIYRWPIAIAARIAISALRTSAFETTTLLVPDKAMLEEYSKIAKVNSANSHLGSMRLN
jgi:O-acetyl-ADP-ribose deacetylase (regulator of RNase III)